LPLHFGHGGVAVLWDGPLKGGITQSFNPPIPQSCNLSIRHSAIPQIRQSFNPLVPSIPPVSSSPVRSCAAVPLPRPGRVPRGSPGIPPRSGDRTVKSFCLLSCQALDSSEKAGIPSFSPLRTKSWHQSDKSWGLGGEAPDSFLTRQEYRHFFPWPHIMVDPKTPQ
jgi:hypothetical protein